MLTDVRGLEVTADNEAAVRHLDDTITHYAGFKLDTGAHLKQALTADPDMAMGLIVRGYFMKLFAVPALEVKARQSLEKAEAAIERRGGSERERRHARALRAGMPARSAPGATATSGWRRRSGRSCCCTRRST